MAVLFIPVANESYRVNGNTYVTDGAGLVTVTDPTDIAALLGRGFAYPTALPDTTGALVNAKPLLTEALTATAIVAAATAVSVIASNANRKTLALINTGSNDAWFGYSSAVTASTGWPLYASGGGYSWTLGECPSGAIYVFSTSGATVIAKEGV